MLSLHIDAPRWRAHADAVLLSTPGLVPVIKGNGYGFGRGLLAAEATRLGVPTVAVGQPAEITDVRAAFEGDILVLQPELPGAPAPARDDRVLRTAASLESVQALQGQRVVIEALTSMQRFGLTDVELGQLADLLPSVQFEGIALHLPIDAGNVGRVAEVDDRLATLRAAHIPVTTLWVSHLTEGELARVAAAHPDVAFRSRIGTRLWLGERTAAQARSTVLAAHRLRKGQRFGYRQHKAPRDGVLLVVGGGTANGVALSAPSPVRGITERAKVAAIGTLEAAGRSLSPFHVDGSQRWFAEPPHMQISMLWLPDGVVVPAVGSEIDVDVRMTTTTFDQVVLEN